MKYFNNISNAEDLKKRFRELSISLHPDRGGNAEEFATMLAEYEEAAKNLNAWTKAEREEVAGIVRGMRVYYFGYGMNCTEYVITKIEGDTVHLVRTFSHDFSSAEDMEYYENEAFRTSQARYIKPVSKKFGIGCYWDDEEGRIYTEQEIKDFVSRANNFVHWYEIYEADKKRKEEEEKAKREAAERLIINKWRKLLRTIPEGAKDATRKAALKNNVKVIFNHYFPGVKVSVSDTSKCWCESSSITWTDGPTVEEVESIEELRYFIARYYEVDPNADYGDYHRCECWQEWRELFGAWSDDNINYRRELSEATREELFAKIVELCPQFAKVDQSDRWAKVTISDEGSNTDFDKLMNLFGLALPVIDWQTATEEERKRYNDISDTRMKIHRRWGFGYMGGGIEEYFTTILKVAADYYRVSEKSEPQPEQPQSEKTETNTATASGVEGVEVVELENGRIAVVGETYEHRATLKAFGGWWNRREQRWEFKPAQAQSVREWLAAQQPGTTPNPDPSPVDGEGGEGGEGETNTHTESAQDEPQPEPQPTEAHTEPQSAQDEQQPEPTTEEPTEGAKGVTISEGLAEAFAKVAAIVAAVVMVATSSAAQPEPETETAKGAKIVFSVDDTPELQEVQTSTPTEPQPETDTAHADRLDALNLARIKAQQLTEENEHTAALFAELEALEACGVDVAYILRDLQALDDEHRRRGYITAGEIQMRQLMREFAINRAAARLSDSEFIALFGKDKQAA